MTDPPLERRFLDNLRDLGIGGSPGHVLVAFSGGLDSTVLLHLLTRHAADAVRVTMAHFDHRMRPDSAEDAGWAAGVAQAWAVPLEVGVAHTPPQGETRAREVRYAFLFDAARRVGATAIATAHHADDQAETVLFRILRGTGVAGLAGIPRRTRTGLVRPLLPFWREELEGYAREHELRWRTDVTNARPGPVRNRIRLELLPSLERGIAPDVRRNLVRLAAVARESEAGWREVVRAAARALERRDGDAIVLVRSRLAEYHPAVATRLVRRALRRFGVVLGRSGTRSVLQFITDAASGREMHLPFGVRIRIEFDDARIVREDGPPVDDRPVVIPALDPAQQLTVHAALGGREYRVEIRRDATPVQDADREAIWRSRISLSASCFPLLLRSRRPGDQVITSGGTKSLKKLMIERRVPRGERASRPVLTDARSSIVWVAGVGTFADPSENHDRVLNLAVYDD